MTGLVPLLTAVVFVAAATGGEPRTGSIGEVGCGREREWRLPPRPALSGTRSSGAASVQLAEQQQSPTAPVGATPTTARQPRPAAEMRRLREDEWHLGSGYAWSVDLLQSAGGREYLPVTISWGRDLTGDAGPGVLRGRLMWAIEIMPLYWQRSPTETVGVALSPLLWRWRFTPRRLAAPFAELAFGGLVTGDPVPEGTESANFLTHGSFGLRWRPFDRAGLVTAYRFQHISNGNQLTTNPGVNAHVLWVGMSVIR